MNVARFLYIGTKVLNLNLAEVEAMPPRKFFTIYNEHLEMNGLKKKDDDSFLDLL